MSTENVKPGGAGAPVEKTPETGRKARTQKKSQNESRMGRNESRMGGGKSAPADGDAKVSISGAALAKKHPGARTTIKSPEEADRVAAGINEAVAANPDVTKIHSFEPDVLQRFSNVIASVFDTQIEAPAT